MWLKYNIEPWEEVVRRWKSTASMRLKDNSDKTRTVLEVYNEWPVLKDPNGLYLVSTLTIIKIVIKPLLPLLLLEIYKTIDIYFLKTNSDIINKYFLKLYGIS